MTSPAAPASGDRPLERCCELLGRLLVLFLALAGTARAHLGHETNTEVRVYADRMRVVVRTSVPFAWSLLGDRAPPMADEAGRAVAKPLLVAAAPGLIEVSAGGKMLAPLKADCLFEVHGDVAFVLNFARPDRWPVTVDARFFNHLEELEAGTLTVFDHTASPFGRDLEPVARKALAPGASALSFSLEAPPAAAPAPPAPAAPPVADGPGAVSAPKIPVPLLVFIAACLAGLLVHRLRRGSGRKS